MACIILKNAIGKERVIPEAMPYQKAIDEEIIGVIWNCGWQPSLTSDEVGDKLTEDGIQWGSAIKWATTQLGLKQCASCKAREVILNHAKENGWIATLKAIKDTF